MLQSPFTYTRKNSSSKKRSYSTSTTCTTHPWDLPTPSTPSVSHKRQRVATSTLTPASTNTLVDKLASMESKVSDLQDNELKFELQDLVKDSLQLLKEIKLPQKSFDEFYTPLTASNSTNTLNSITEDMYETPKERIINYDKLTSPPRIPKLGYYLQTMIDEIESTGLDF
ncbi:hypothetical protein Cantr_01182 [Candida viswanathii]|uniref:Uncharacterized protein n=1 Tax=Candida viswanathii TaxID=5486 RepID=A0A367YIM3_9ASCO|nr:hypothetical protein Cantr_01182 [Candida viswanathii]